MALPTSRRIAKAAVAAFGGKPAVHRHWDDANTTSVDIVSCVNTPAPGISSYATVGVSNQPLVLNGKDIGVRAELLIAGPTDNADFGNYLASAAMFVLKDERPVAPGVIFDNVLTLYDRALPMRHLLFLPPFLWDDGPTALELDEISIAWLLAVPISDQEMELATTEGVSQLETLFEDAQIDVYDLWRPSVV